MNHLSDEFLGRVKRAYRLSIQDWPGINHFFWGGIYERQRPIHDALMADDYEGLRRIFANPGATDLYYGVDGLFAEALSTTVLDGISRDVCEKLLGNAIRIMGTDDIEFPNPFPGEMGFPTPRGIASERAINAAFQAWTIQRILGQSSSRKVVEIGPGMGRTAYYAFKYGIDYTTIDLPMGVVAQACFLGATLGPSHVWLIGDPPMPGAIRLFPTSRPLPAERFDLALNSDSLTEMSHGAAADYVAWIGAQAAQFLSINHLMNDIKAATICDRYLNATTVRREDYPLRPGYLIEHYAIEGLKPGFRHRYRVHRAWDSVKYRLGYR